MTSEDTSTGEINDFGNVCLSGSMAFDGCGALRYYRDESTVPVRYVVLEVGLSVVMQVLW